MNSSHVGDMAVSIVAMSGASWLNSICEFVTVRVCGCKCVKNIENAGICLFWTKIEGVMGNDSHKTVDANITQILLASTC